MQAILIRYRHFAVVLVLIGLLEGCATPIPQHAIQVGSGRVSETFDAGAIRNTPSHAQTASVASVSPVAAAILSAGTESEPAHKIYVVELRSGAKRYVRTQAQFPVGSCVSIFTYSSAAANDSWLYGHASLRTSAECD